jgi:hypothetical protein
MAQHQWKLGKSFLDSRLVISSIWDCSQSSATASSTCGKDIEHTGVVCPFVGMSAVNNRQIYLVKVCDGLASRAMR